MQITPQAIAVETYAEFPSRYRVGRRTLWSDYNPHVKASDCFLEGPSFDREGNLLVVDIPFGRIFRIDRERHWSLVAEYDGWPTGLKLHRDGRIHVADYRRGIVRIGRDGTVETLAEGFRSERFKGPNDLVFGARGELYFTDQGQTGLQDPSGRVFRLDADGQLSLLLGGIPSPNGIALNLTGDQLYIAVTRANAVWRAPLLPDGTTSKVGVWLQLSGAASGPDGLALDQEGGLVVAHLGMSILRFDRFGRLTHFLEPGYGLFATNIAFDADDPHWLYVVDSGNARILRARLPVPGHLLYSHVGSPVLDRK